MHWAESLTELGVIALLDWLRKLTRCLAICRGPSLLTSLVERGEQQ